MKKLITFSLWGDREMFWYGAEKNAELAKTLLPEFICRFYIDKESPIDRIKSLESLDNVEVVIVESASDKDKEFENRTGFEGMFWRFWAVDDEDVEIVLSRDCDSRISEREVSAINEWIRSEREFHIIRDHPNHLTPIMGGMWGCRTKVFKEIGFKMKNISQLYHSQKTNSVVGKDQDFLAEVVYPLVRKKSLEHSEFGISYGELIYKLPKERINYEFVGDSFDENDVRNPDYWKIIKNVIG